MTYTIRITAPAQRGLGRLEEGVRAAALQLIYGDLAEKPYVVGKPLQRDLAGQHGARRGDYRVFYRIVEEERAIEVTAADHRRDVYRRR